MNNMNIEFLYNIFYIIYINTVDFLQILWYNLGVLCACNPNSVREQKNSTKKLVAVTKEHKFCVFSLPKIETYINFKKGMLL